MSNNLNLSQVAAAQNQKEVTINDQAGEIDAALTEDLVMLVDDGNATTLTLEQFRRAFFFVITPDETLPSNAVTITVPAVPRGLFKVRNLTAQTVTVTVSGQSEEAPVIATGEGALLSCDGSDVLPEGSGGGGIEALGDIGDVDVSGLQAGDMLRRNGSNQWVAERTPFLLSMFIPGVHGSGALMAQIVFDRNVAFDEDLPSSQGYAQVAAADETVLDIQKNGAKIGTITFADAGNTVTFALAGGASFAAGDRLAIVNQDPADATLADLALTFRGRRI
jgi:hypothetical protein